ncbi:hypothetical protein B0O80DRAFT_30298 [Mortierella sp. GBAus27b]|nr:Synapse-associated protein 1 [Mortierella sp. GBA43]KAI8355730.1 hypothetical protein B0O80DRAFT_30298 [Mortierella sp. GBAus27b]
MDRSAETTDSSRPADPAAPVTESTADHSSSANKDAAVDKVQDPSQNVGATKDEASVTGTKDVDQEQKSQEQQQPQSFTAAVFPGFNPPKITTPAFFSSMQGKLQTTLANAKAPNINKVDMKQIQTSTGQIANTTKDWSLSAFRSLSSAAQRVSANVTQGIQKEHEEFIKQKKLETVNPHQGTESLPPWTGMPDEEKIKARILSLSRDKRNFVLPPPPGTDFVFDMNAYSSTAMATLKHDPNLDRMRFYLVPREVEELIFWRNYFYRVSLLKQVALAVASGAPDALEGAQGETTEGESSGNDKSRSRPLSESSMLGYNIYFGENDAEGSPKRTKPSSATAKEQEVPPPTSPSTAKNTSKPAVAKKEEKSEVLFEAEMPAHDEDPDAWLEKQLASGIAIADDGADVDVGDWEKELQNELKDYVEES